MKKTLFLHGNWEWRVDFWKRYPRRLNLNSNIHFFSYLCALTIYNNKPNWQSMQHCQISFSCLHLVSNRRFHERKHVVLALLKMSDFLQTQPPKTDGPRQKRKFSTYFKSLVIELDRELYGPDNHLVEVNKTVVTKFLLQGTKHQIIMLLR